MGLRKYGCNVSEQSKTIFRDGCRFLFVVVLAIASIVLGQRYVM